MRRYLIPIVVFLLTIPVGLSIQGCQNKNRDYCNGEGYGYPNSQLVSIILQPQTYGISVAFGQISQQTLSATAYNCKGSTVTATYIYGTTDRTIADVSPTGKICGGTWNYFTPAVPAYTTCIPTNKTGVAYVTATAGAFTSNQVAVYSYPPISSLTVQGPTNSSGQPACLSQGQTKQLDATAYCASTGLTGQCPSPPSAKNPNVPAIPVGQPVQICAPSQVNPQANGYGATDCNNVIGHINYTPSNSSVVTIDQNGVATAQEPGATVISGNISTTGSGAGYFYTCPPKSIALTVGTTGTVNGTVTPNTPQALSAVVTDVNNHIITGVPLSYVSTNPTNIAVNSAGSVTSLFPATSYITAVCEPPTCNPAPINVRGVLGAGTPIMSNFTVLNSPGQDSTYIWVASPNSPYFVPIDYSTGTVGNQVKLPYQPNSMMEDSTGSYLYFGSYYELMVYSATTNQLTSQIPTVPGVVLAVAPNNAAVLVNDQERGLFYLYSPSTGTGTSSSSASSTSGIYSSFHGIGQHAAFTPDGQTVYIVGQGVLYIHNTFTGWSVEPLPSGQGTDNSVSCPATNSSSYPNNPNVYPPNTPQNPNNSFNTFCAPDLAVTVPSSAVFLTGSQTSAYGQCPEVTPTTIVNYPIAGTISNITDHMASTADGAHIIAASTNPPQLTDISVNVPTGACPTNGGLTTGFTFNPALSSNQFSLAPYNPSLIDQVITSTDLPEAFITYSTNAATAPKGGALLPVYQPSTVPGDAGTLSNVILSGSATAPVTGIFSPDNTLFYVGTSGDNLLHVISTQTLKEIKTLNPGLTDINGKPTPPVFLAVKPRQTS